MLAWTKSSSKKRFGSADALVLLNGERQELYKGRARPLGRRKGMHGGELDQEMKSCSSLQEQQHVKISRIVSSNRSKEVVEQLVVPCLVLLR